MKAFAYGAMLLTLLVGCTAEPSVTWIEGAPDASGQACHQIVLQHMPAGAKVWFARIPEAFSLAEDTEAPMQWYMGNSHYIRVPDPAPSRLVVKYVSAPLPRRSWAPEGFALQSRDEKGKKLRTQYQFLAEHPQTRIDPSWFETEGELAAWDLVPAVKRCQLLSSDLCAKPTRLERLVAAAWEDVLRPAGWYRLRIEGEKALVEAQDEDGYFYAGVTLDKLPEQVPDLLIEDWPDLPYRGIMLDVARNFTDKEGVERLLDLLAGYKVNYLHFHLVDDEGWRLEIPALPELTAYASHHALPVEKDGVFSEPDALMPGTDGSVWEGTMGSGYYTQDDYKEILRYAWERRIRVIPEIDTPGHSRAAIKAMNRYAERVGDDRYLLVTPGDSSRYYSAQAFTDDVLDVTREGVYRFMEQIFDELIRLHAEAGVPLDAIHIGGDEVAMGAWAGHDRIEMKDDYIHRMIDMAQAKGVRLAGWQEITMGIRPGTLERLIPSLFFVNAWSTLPGSEEVPYQMANAGYPVLLSNVTNTYIDLAYGDAFDEVGLDWGGYVDERKTFALQPYRIYQSVRWEGVDTPVDVTAAAEGKLPLLRPDRIRGVQVQLWSENLRSFDDLTYQIFPKALGVFERGWNAHPSWEDDAAFKTDFQHFYRIVAQREMPRWDKAGVRYKQR